MVAWHKYVPVGGVFKVKSKRFLNHWQEYAAGKRGIAGLGYGEETPISLSGLDFGSGNCCFHPSQLLEVKEGQSKKEVNYD